ncbi:MULTISPECIES: glycosyltransferase family 87 protein [unclassified Mesorhizobium]|uniref:glycosyltransferase family 87 protein n=1 Tax=unclassified Mesorhizobium TaxID=325217 RepID=UPI001FDFFE73|nr:MULTISPECIES: glycosyltransferase family 87 protein [unclassified Mesorhizobium]
MAQADQTARNRSDFRFAALVLCTGILIGLRYHLALWTFDEHGFSELSDRLPYWDFTNLWAGGRMALDGHVAWLFDVDSYRAALRRMFSPDLPNQEWSYPPSILVFGVPLALLPIFAAYFIWTFGTVFCLWLAVRPLKLGKLAEAAVLVCPAVFINAIFGQNGALTTALLIGGLAVAPKRPILAGLLFGLLTIKPHLGILVPFCLLASGNWRAIAAAALSSAALFILTGLSLGFDVWHLFWTETRPLMTAILEAPYPQPYQANAATMFFLARACGAGLTVAYAMQAAATIAAICAAIWVWLPRRQVVHGERVVLTAVLATVATPYGYSYDTVGLAVAVAYLFSRRASMPRIFLALVWLYPAIAHLVNGIGLGIGVLVPLSLSAWMLADIRARERVTSTIADGRISSPR